MDIKKTKDGIIISIKVIPKSSIDKIVGWENTNLKIKLKAVPEKGKANAYLIKFLAKKLSIVASNIELVSGETSRIKKILIKGVSLEEVNHLLEKLK